MSSEIPLVDVKPLKVAELREELAKRGLDTKGVKKDLAERLQHAQDEHRVSLDDGPPPPEVRDAATPLGGSSSAVEVRPEISEHPVGAENTVANTAGDLGVGHTMVEGAEEAKNELQEQEEAMDTKEEEALQPAALDEEVAEIISKEEAKDALPPSPISTMAISPAPPTPEGQPPESEAPNEQEEVEAPETTSDRPGTPPLPPPAAADVEDDMQMDIEDGPASPPPPGSRKRRAPEDRSVSPPKRPRARRTYDEPLPLSLSHLLHPPTSCLYIINLRRPLLRPSLHEYLFSDPTSSTSYLLPPPAFPFASPDHPGLWLSGVKDHAYATYASTSDALDAAQRIEGKIWPEETGQEIKVQFIPDERVEELVRREEDAWSRGRQKLTLKIVPPVTEGDEWDFELTGSGGLGARPARASRPVEVGAGGGLPARPLMGGGAPTGPGGRLPYAPPLSGTNGISIRAAGPAPSGPGMGPGPGLRAEPRSGPRAGPGAGPSPGMGMGMGGGTGGEMGIRGRAGYGPPPHALEVRRGEPPRPVLRGPREREGRLANPVRMTKVRPVVAWREGPGAWA